MRCLTGISQREFRPSPWARDIRLERRAAGQCEAPEPDGTVYFGAWVTLEDEQGATCEYRLVGPDESDATEGRISVEAPLGRALLGKREGDSFELERPRGRTAFTVLSVRYVGE